MKSLLLVLATLSCMPAHAVVCGQLVGVEGSSVEVLRLQRDRSTDDKVRYAMKIEESKVMALDCDDVVLTGRDSSAKVIFADSKVAVGPETRFEISAHAKRDSKSGEQEVNLLSLTYGKLRALVSPSKEKTKEKSGEPSARFQIKTYSAVVGVRGTDFYVSYDPNAALTEQVTIDGLVEVKQTGGQQVVQVSGGNQVVVTDKPARVLSVTAIQDSVRNDVRRVSAVVRDDKEFTHVKAVEVLGSPKAWVLEREKVPENLKNLKDEF